MNVYVSLRVIFHCLLLVDNLLALTAAAWSIQASGGEGPPRASPGAVLVIVGFVAYFFMSLMIWAETFFHGTLFSRVRTELTLVPMLIIFQLIGASVSTSNVIENECHDPTSCIALLILSWIAAFSLIVYYLVVLLITFDHAKFDPTIWDVSLLEHPWFLRPPPPLSKETHIPPRPFIITPPLAVRVPTIVSHRRQRSSWDPPSRLSSRTDSFPFAHATSSPSGSTRYTLIPKWARYLTPSRRGVEEPFPVLSRAAPERSNSPPRLDAPVSPATYSLEV